VRSPLRLDTLALLLLAALAVPGVASGDDPPPPAPNHVHDHGDAGKGPDTHAHGGFHARPDAHAPIGVMGEHMHRAGEFMLSYRWMRMRMDGNRDGTKSLSPQDVLDRGYMATPLDMDMEMHMWGLMWAPVDWLTLAGMFPYVRLSMDHVNAADVGFTTKSDGAGDLNVSGLWRLWENERHHLHLNTGVSFPTGTIRNKDLAPTVETLLPFPMQLGSGTFDLMPGMTYVGHASLLSWGGQAMGTIRLDENKSEYRLGNRVDLTAWLALPWTKWLSTSARIAWHYWGNISGDEDAPPPPGAIPTADPKLRGGHRIEILPGVNLQLPLGPLGTHRFALEGGFPVFQHLKGPQLETDWRIIVGWQKAF
jgi:hypothetical protein